MQTYSDIELILAHGDKTQCENFNIGLGKSTGDYVRWLHDDDLLLPDCVENQVKAMEKVDFIHGNAYFFSSSITKVTPYVPKIKLPTLADIITHNHIHSETTMYRRGIFDKIGGYDESLLTAEDMEFNLRCLAHGYKIGYCNKFLAYYRVHGRQKSRIDGKEIRRKRKQDILDKYRKML